MKKNTKNIIIVILFLLFVFVASFFLNIKINNVKDVSYKKGWDDAKARLYTQIGPIATDSAITDMVFGAITKINENKIDIKINSTELLSLPELDNRIVVINNQTKIYQFQMKNDKKYKGELENYYGENNIDANTFIPGPGKQLGPDKYEQVLVSLENLQSGQLVNIYADKNIKESKSFIAKEIIIKK
jgi:hypothetical protein